MQAIVPTAKYGLSAGQMEVLMCDRSLETSSQTEVYLVATPQRLVEIFNTVDKTLSSPKGCASIQLTTPSDESFTLHIVRQLDKENG